ncbi:hypothetical protein ACWN8V_10325 [Vagococcus elongatus]|uniref:Uncharacterized protein n=1 Tax=Vagococcus elongatus TaxID=180344 RepID=A0A430APQ3_9ENTE|nr:hypothetical protein [Vagococcus elongatus]RSU10140.1 hypothetical protein CBF29_10150 [Vagococcus elongatus]
MFKKSFVLITSCLLLFISGCGSKDKDIKKEAKESTVESTEKKPELTLEDILNEYTNLIVEVASNLVEEYNAEYPSVENGIEGLEELSNRKIDDLAIISNDGINKMATLVHESESIRYEEYEEWAGKLTEVYTIEAQKITDAYWLSVNNLTSVPPVETDDAQPPVDNVVEEAP